MQEFDTIENNQSLTDEEFEQVLTFLLAHKRELIDDFLRERSLPFSNITKSELRERLRDYVNSGALSVVDLVELLNKIEGWGDQHVYLFNSPENLLEKWADEKYVKEQLQKLGLIQLLDHPRPLWLPSEPELASIEWEPTRVRFVWVVEQQGRERVSGRDKTEGDLIFQAWRVIKSRGLVAFDWNLLDGSAMLMIRKLPTAYSRSYSKEREKFAQQLDPIIQLSLFKPVRIATAIRRIERSDNVRRHELNYKTRQLSTIGFRSADKTVDTKDDATLANIGSALDTQDTSGLLGDFYWLASEYLSEELHTVIYTDLDDDQRVNIWGEYRENDVRYVLSCIREFCR